MSPKVSRKLSRSLKHSVNAPEVDAAPPPKPSIPLLFSLLSRRQILLLLVPAAISSAVAGGIAPFMTFVVGQAFDAFATFSVSDSSQAAKDKLLHRIGIAALELVALAAGALALGSLTSSLWIWLGEHNAMAIRKRVYDAVTGKDLAWFDTNMGAEGEGGEKELLGAGGLMTKFARCVSMALLHRSSCNRFAQRNRRRPHGFVSSLRNMSPISHNEHHLLDPRLPTIIHPHFYRSSHCSSFNCLTRRLPRIRFAAFRLRTFSHSISCYSCRTCHRLHKHSQSLQRNFARKQITCFCPYSAAGRFIQINCSMERHFISSPVCDDGNVRARVLVRLEAGEGGSCYCWGRHGCLLGMFDCD